MNSEEILKFCLENGLLVDKEVLNLFSESGDLESAKIIIKKIKHHTQKKIITKSLFSENKDQVNRFFEELPEEKKKSLELLKINYLGVAGPLSFDKKGNSQRIANLVIFNKNQWEYFKTNIDT